jgi:hypothetical protein
MAKDRIFSALSVAKGSRLGKIKEAGVDESGGPRAGRG